jgi:hypothetical protein
MQFPLAAIILIFDYFLLANICEAVNYSPFNKYVIFLPQYKNSLPIGEHLRNVRKVSNFTGAQNLRFG